MNVTKQQRAFYRKLYLSHLISNGEHNVRSLHLLTGMPRRTLQDTIKDLSDIGISCHFEQQEGGRNNAGIYRIDDWGPIRPEWVSDQLPELTEALGVCEA